MTENPRTQSGSQKLIHNLLGVSVMALFFIGAHFTSRWPNSGDFLWKVGYTIGAMNTAHQLALFVGILCLAGAAVLQLIRVLFQTSRR